MKRYEREKLLMWLYAVHGDLSQYLENPQEFTPEYFEDVAECVDMAIALVEKLSIEEITL